MTSTERLSTALAGRYRIDRELGAGGMATVYLAHDVKHGRDVAIKVLHPDLGAALGSDRFLSEIRTTARLQHPHILPLLDSGDADGLLYYVMPVVSGETLRTRLERERQLPIPEAVRIAREVANALDYAHRHGGIHRDIKPENIPLHDGQAMVADFGIALAVQSAGGQRMTQTGLSLGTPQYMSPEQAMGERAIDARSDVYALGAVTYEMLAGDAPFTGSSVQAIVAKVLAERPTPLHTLRDTVPAGVEQAVLTALAKLPADRFATAAEFATALGADAGSMLRSHGGVAHHRARPRTVLLTAVAALATIAAVWGWTRPGAFAGGAGTAAAVTRVAVAVHPANEIRPAATGWSIDLSPDGTRLAYIGRGTAATTSQLWVRSLDALEPSPIAGTLGAGTVRWSPDGRALYFTGTAYPEGAIVPADGGPVIALGGAGDRAGSRVANDASWGSRDHIFMFVRRNSTIVRQAIGGAIDTVFRGDSTREAGGLSVLPDESAALFVEGPRSATEYADEQIVAVALKTGTRSVIGPGVFVRYLATGHLLWVLADGIAMFAPFDAGTLRLTGPAVAVTKVGFYSNNARVYPAISASNNGTLTYLSGALQQARLVWLDGTSRGGRATGIEGDLWGVSISPDGSRVAFALRRVDLTSARGNSSDVWVQDLKSGARVRLTTAWVNMRPSWSADGRYVLWARVGGNPRTTLVERRADASEPEQVVLTPSALRHSVAEGRWLPDHRTLIVRTYGDSGKAPDVFSFTLGVDTAGRPVATSPANEVAPRPSPDGTLVAYVSDESGTRDLYVQPYPTGGGRIAIAQGGVTSGSWSRDGRRLYYWDERGKLMAASIQARPSLTVLSRTEVADDFSLALGLGGTYGQFDVAPDGRVLAAEQMSNTFELILVRNWMAGLGSPPKK